MESFKSQGGRGATPKSDSAAKRAAKDFKNSERDRQVVGLVEELKALSNEPAENPKVKTKLSQFMRFVSSYESEADLLKVCGEENGELVKGILAAGSELLSETSDANESNESGEETKAP